MRSVLLHFSPAVRCIQAAVVLLLTAAAAAAPARMGSIAQCEIGGRIVSSEYHKVGGAVERAIVYAYPIGGGQSVANVSAKGESYALRLPPGRYRLRFSAVGSRGATFDGKEETVTVRPGQRALDVGTVDLPVSKTTRLYGLTAPELDGAAGWRNTRPGKLAQLRGRVVILDFFAHYCSICHVHAPELARLVEKYGKQGLAVLAVHDDSVASVEEMDEKMKPVVKQYWGGKDLALPTALDGGGEKGIFRAYGISGVPALILIDQQGRVVRRFHHAGDPDLEKELQRLLSPRRRGR